jgi:hypothetical protein
MRINISNHAKFTTVKRKLNLLPLTIDYDIPQAVWPFQIEHYDVDGVTLIDGDLSTVQGQFTINNSRNVDATTGTKVPVGSPGVPEFNFLVALLKQVNVEPLVLGTQRVAVSDARGILNDYKNLMKL